jgi:hypothetical protein
LEIHLPWLCFTEFKIAKVKSFSNKLPDLEEEGIRASLIYAASKVNHPVLVAA